MKKIIFLVLIANAFTIFTFTSCKKENLRGPSDIHNDAGTPPYSTTLNLVAGNWTQEDGMYVNTFSNIFSPALSDVNRVKVYMVGDEGETEINQFVSFLDGELWAETTHTDLKIFYRTSAETLPFHYLTIKVVIE